MAAALTAADITGLLVQARGGPEDVKLRLLSEVTTVVTKRQRALLPTFFADVVEFLKDESDPVTKLVLRFAGDVVKEDGEYLRLVLPVVKALWGEHHPDVPAGNPVLAKRIVHMLFHAFPSILRFAKTAKTRESKEIWDSLMALVNRLADAVLQRAWGGPLVRDATTRLLDTIARHCVPNLEEVHPFLNSAKQREVAASATSRLLAALQGPLPSCSPESLALIVSHVAATAVEVPLHRPAVIPALAAFQASPPEGLVSHTDAGPRLHVALLQPLRVGLIKLLGAPGVARDPVTGFPVTGDAAARVDQLVVALTALGWAEKAQGVLAPPVDAVGPGDRLAQQEEEAGQGPRQEWGSLEDVGDKVIAADDYNAIAALHPSTIASIVIANMRYMPPQPTTPALALTRAEEACQRMVSLGPHLARCGGLKWNAKRCRLVTLLACDPTLSSLDAIVHDRLHAAEDVAGAMDTDADASASVGGADTPVGAAGGSSAGTPEADASPAVAADPIVDAGIIVKFGGLEGRMGSEAPVACLDNFMRATGQQEVVEATRVRLQDEIVVHVLADFHTRKQLAFELLKAELRFSEAQGRPSRYSHLLLRLLNGVLSGDAASASASAVAVAGAGGPAGAPPAPLVGAEAAVDIITNCPIVLPEVIRILKEYCLCPDQDADGVQTIITLLVDTAIARPEARSLALDVVLPLCCASDDRLRGMSIFALCSQISSEGFVLGEVQEFARALLESLPLDPAPVAVEPDLDAMMADAIAEFEGDAGEGWADVEAEAQAQAAADGAGSGSVGGASEPGKSESQPEQSEDAAARAGGGGDDKTLGLGHGVGDGEGEGGEGEEEEDAGEDPVVPSRWSIPVLTHGPRNVSECRWRLDLFRGLCTKDFDFLQAIAEVFIAIKPALQGPIITELTPVVNKIVSSESLEQFVARAAEFPPSAVKLAVSLVCVAIDSSPSRKPLKSGVVDAARAMHDKFSQDGSVYCLVPVLPVLPVGELTTVIPKLWTLDAWGIKTAFDRMFSTGRHKCALPKEAALYQLLVSFSAEHPGAMAVALDATAKLFGDTERFPQPCVQAVLQHLVETKPRPVLIFRCMCLAYKSNKTSTMAVVCVTLLSALVSKSPPWDDEEAGKGFVAVVRMLLPRTMPVLLQVPEAFLCRVLTDPAAADLRGAVREYVQSLLKNPAPRKGEPYLVPSNTVLGLLGIGAGPVAAVAVASPPAAGAAKAAVESPAKTEPVVVESAAESVAEPGAGAGAGAVVTGKQEVVGDASGDEDDGAEEGRASTGARKRARVE